MIAYGYDKEGFYTGEKTCQLDPIETAISGNEVWLLPANATYEKPPKEKEGYFVKFKGGSWVYEKIPTPPIPPEPTEDEKKEIVRAVRNSYLQGTDYTQLEDAPFTEEEKAEYREYRQYLRDYTDTENWWESNPKTFNEWKK